MKEFAVKVHEILGLRDLSRIDVILDSDDNIWFLDANVTPGMTDTSLLPLAAKEHSSFTEILSILYKLNASAKIKYKR